MMVSIIVPVFNCEKYIHRCLESLIHQTYRDIEIVLVNDGSSDRSQEIIAQYAEEDNRVVLYNQTNKGVSTARNFGIEQSKGDYLMFVDADDYVELNMVAEMVEKIQNENSIVFCDNSEIWADHIDERRLFCEQRDQDLNKELVLTEIASGRAGLVCGKMFERSVVEKHDIWFDSNVKVCEDQLFFLEVVSHCEHFIHIPMQLYHYDRRNENSATIKYQTNALENQLYVLQNIETLLLKSEMPHNVRETILHQRYGEAVQFCINNEVIHATLGTFKEKVSKIKDIISNEKVSSVVVSLETTNVRYKVIKWGLKNHPFFIFIVFFILNRIVLPIKKSFYNEKVKFCF